ncbi:MAG: deaminase [Candidatus Pacebacteria bacterium]|nr:deaminase [Candidatus Paceibacterota bacterium]
MKKIAIAYIPVLHSGYLEFFRTIPSDVPLFIISEDLIASFGGEFDYLKRKDALRALSSSEMVKAVQGLSLLRLKDVHSLNVPAVHLLEKEDLLIVCPNEDITRAVVEKYFSGAEVEFHSIFLRWHRDNVDEQNAVSAHRSVNVESLHYEMMERAQKEADKSFDWWRQVGGVLVKDNTPILYARNTHVPDEQGSNVFGDPRSIFKRGIRLDLTTAEHAEAILIVEAARRGISTEGAWLYVTAFPCPSCAMHIARAGISRCYFSGGYAKLDGESTLKDAGVELVLLET